VATALEEHDRLSGIEVDKAGSDKLKELARRLHLGRRRRLKPLLQETDG
jgi:hypothetical protein